MLWAILAGDQSAATRPRTSSYALPLAFVDTLPVHQLVNAISPLKNLLPNTRAERFDEQSAYTRPKSFVGIAAADRYEWPSFVRILN